VVSAYFIFMWLIQTACALGPDISILNRFSELCLPLVIRAGFRVSSCLALTLMLRRKLALRFCTTYINLLGEKSFKWGVKWEILLFYKINI